MFGFRQHRSAQDLLLQLDRDIVNPVEHPFNDKAALALVLKGAFDNVTHNIILPNDRQSLIRIHDEEHGPYQLGTRGTPQGAVVSPSLFCLAMMKLPAQLPKVEGVQHALYADDITIWAKHGSQAAEIVDAYARRCGLQCSTSKSDFVHIRSSPRCTTKMELSLASGPMPEHDEIRVLGLFIHKNRLVDTTLAKLRKVGDQVGRMVRRVPNKRGGLRCEDVLWLAHTFVTSRGLYSTPYLHLPKFDKTALEVRLRKMYKRALDLPINPSNQRLMGLGMGNTFAEVREAHLTNQYTRLSKTPSGRRLLARLHIHHPTLTEKRVRIPEVWRYALHVRPLPANMTRDDYSGLRLARAAALARHYVSKPGIFYVDASGPHHGGGTRPQSSTKTSRKFEQGYIPLFAYRILKDSDYLGAPASRTIVWAPANMSLEGNETADAAARVLTLRSTPSDPSETDPEPNPALGFREFTQLYQFGHAMYPKPCKGLTKAEERTLLRLYTKTLLCPAVLKLFDPAYTGKCPHCAEKSSEIFHMVWARQSTPILVQKPNPTREDWKPALLDCSDLGSQKALVNRARAVTVANGLLH
ncbi:hypothetical protein HPB47_007020 [Ixodes persulcatus]|uniref:Uncharacterized protein n=1 Tax=Ixodes persulcatus TaxID=34615 RepID=A0AC60P8R6_IXOPE|nr:hypothetical protein HPB47_007020 [Ixodes persulcatus]